MKTLLFSPSPRRPAPDSDTSQAALRVERIGPALLSLDFCPITILDRSGGGGAGRSRANPGAWAQPHAPSASGLDHTHIRFAPSNSTAPTSTAPTHPTWRWSGT